MAAECRQVPGRGCGGGGNLERTLNLWPGLLEESREQVLISLGSQCAHLPLGQTEHPEFTVRILGIRLHRVTFQKHSN